MAMVNGAACYLTGRFHPMSHPLPPMQRDGAFQPFKDQRAGPNQYPGPSRRSHTEKPTIAAKKRAYSS